MVKNLVVLFLALCLSAGLQAQVQLVTPERAAAMMQRKRTVVLDVRTKEEFREGHLPGAVHADVLDSAGFLQQMQLLRKNRTYVVYCRSGKRSTRASELLYKNNFKHIYNMEGGILAWKGVLQKNK